jgi:hypothetical protein
MTEVVKVQTSLVSSVPDELILVYAEGRKNAIQMPFPDGLREKLGGARKAYFNATWTGKTWCIRDLTPDQEW